MCEWCLQEPSLNQLILRMINDTESKVDNALSLRGKSGAVPRPGGLKGWTAYRCPKAHQLDTKDRGIKDQGIMEGFLDARAG